MSSEKHDYMATTLILFTFRHFLLLQPLYALNFINMGIDICSTLLIHNSIPLKKTIKMTTNLTLSVTFLTILCIETSKGTKSSTGSFAPANSN